MNTCSRTPHGVRELKLITISSSKTEIRRTPHGVRELKRAAFLLVYNYRKSHPTRGA